MNGVAAVGRSTGDVALAASGAPTSGAQVSAVTVGGGTAGGTAFSGQLSDVTLFRRALAADAVLALANQVRPPPLIGRLLLLTAPSHWLANQARSLGLRNANFGLAPIVSGALQVRAPPHCALSLAATFALRPLIGCLPITAPFYWVPPSHCAL